MIDTSGFSIIEHREPPHGQQIYMPKIQKKKFCSSRKFPLARAEKFLFARAEKFLFARAARNKFFFFIKNMFVNEIYESPD